MTAASSFRGLTEVSLSSFAPEDPNNRFVAAYPTFRSFAPPGSAARDEIVLLRRSAATAPTARQLGAMAGALPVSDENDVPAVFRAVNPVALPAQRGYPTFSYGQSGLKRFMNVVTFRPGFTILVAPENEPGFSDPTDVEAVVAAAHVFARAHNFAAGIPTFNVVPLGPAMGHEVVAFPLNGGAVPNSDTTPGAPPPSGGWRLESVPVANDSGAFAVASDDDRIILFNVSNGELREYARDPQLGFGPFHAIDPFVDGTRHSQIYIEGLVSAATTAHSVDVIWAGHALFHARRPRAHPGQFQFWTIDGREAPDPTGLTGYFNHLAVGPGDDLHALSYLSTFPDDLPPDRKRSDLLQYAFDAVNGTWPRPPDFLTTVDGDINDPRSGSADLGHVAADAGQMSTLAFEPDGRIHAFYYVVIPADGATPASARLRHAVQTHNGWLAETLDGSGSSAPPATSGTGPTRANVGANPTAVYFDGALWVIYEDRTWGNLRCARGTRDAAGALHWAYHVVDGNARQGRTGGVVRSAVAVLWSDVLSVFYGDMTASVIRHAWRRAGDARWKYELLDGAGGPDGRVDAAVFPAISACADAATRQRVFVAYRWDGGAGSSLRLAILG